MGQKPQELSVGWSVDHRRTRCALVSLADARIIAETEVDLESAAARTALPGRREPLAEGSWLLHPESIWAALKKSLAAALREAKASPAQIVVAGVATEASWIVPVTREGQALAETPFGKSRPAAWTQPPSHRPPLAQAHRLRDLARRHDEAFLQAAGGRISTRTYWPRFAQLFEDDRETLERAAGLLELGEYLVGTLVGQPVTGGQARNARALGIHGTSSFHGPSARLWEQWSRELAALAARPLPGREGAGSPGSAPAAPATRQPAAPSTGGGAIALRSGLAIAGTLSARGAALLGLKPGTPIAQPQLSEYASVVGAGRLSPGRIVIVLDDPSTLCGIGRGRGAVASALSVTESSLLPGTLTYEFCQTGLRDMLDWFAAWVREAPSSLGRAAKSGNGNASGDAAKFFATLTKEAGALRPGQSGLLALDWWAGSESPLRDPALSGVLIGLRPGTSGAHIYRALLEAAAFGTYTLLRSLESGGVLVRDLTLAGPLAEQHPLLARMIADATGRDIYPAGCQSPAAVGAALVAAAATRGNPFPVAAAQSAPAAPTSTAASPAGPAAPDTLQTPLAELSARVRRPAEPLLRADRALRPLYERLYDQYVSLHNALGNRTIRVLHELDALRNAPPPTSVTGVGQAAPAAAKPSSSGATTASRSPAPSAPRRATAPTPAATSTRARRRRA